jgi:hypothetical protein
MRPRTTYYRGRAIIKYSEARSGMQRLTLAYKTIFAWGMAAGDNPCYSLKKQFGDRRWSCPMEPTNDHEREIARLIDQRALSEGKLDYTAVPSVAAALSFLMSRSDSEFLIAYLHWRMNNPPGK